MFNPFNQPAQNSAPAFNPFASNPKPSPPSQGNPLSRGDAADSSGSKKDAPKNPFLGAGDSAPKASNPFASNPNTNPPSQGNPFSAAADSFGSKASAPKNSFSSAGDSAPKTSSPFSALAGNQSDNGGKQKFRNPFAANDGDSSDGGKKKRKPGPKSKTKSPQPPGGKLANGHKGFLKALPEDSGFTNEARKRPASRQPSPSDAPGDQSDDSDSPAASQSNDPHAKKVYEQLRRDGISPPQWPSQPGQPRNKAAMSKFRDSYEAYRTKVRASLTKAGLIDDPEKRKSLKDAIVFKGICEDMCPEFEKITRITEFDVNQPEKNPRTSIPNTRRMVKKLARSAAGQEAPLPMDVRSVPALRRTLDYLVDTLLRNDGNLPALHGFLWDRTRAIRRDFTFFSTLTPEELKTQVYVLENIARFHVTALHILSQDGKAPEDFVEQQELEQLGKSLLSLRDVYDDCNEQGITCENEPEFRAYYLIFHAHDPNIMEILQRQWNPKLWRDSDDVRTAVSLVEAMQNTQDFHGPLNDAPSMAAASAYRSYLKIVEDSNVSYTMACFAECHFPRIRRSILSAVKRALSRPKESAKDVTAAELNKFLRFDTIQEATAFAELHGLEFSADPEAPSDPSRRYLVLNNRNPLPQPRLQHQFSRDLVEKKRGSRALPALIHETVFEDGSSAQKPDDNLAEESLFVPDEENRTDSNNLLGTSSQAAPLAQAAWGKPSDTHPSQPTPSPFASPPTANPFGVSQAITGAPLSQSKPSDASPAFKGPFASSPGAGSSGTGFQLKPSSGPVFGATDGQSVGKGATPLLGIGTGQPSTPLAGAFSSATSSSRPSPFAAANASTKDAATDPASTAGGAAQAQTTTPSIPAPSGPIFSPSSKPSTTTDTTVQSMFPNIQQPAPNFHQPTSSFPGTSPAAPASQPAIESPQQAFAPAAQKPASTEGSPLAPSLMQKAAGGSAEPSGPPSLPVPRQPSRPKDLLGDFTKWFVQGDNGLLADFEVFMVDNILSKVFDDFKKQQEETRRREEEERDMAKADKFRTYNLSLRMFYRWRERAREKRLKELRRQGREQAREFYEAQRAAQLKARKEATRKSEEEEARRVELNRPEELMSMLKNRKATRKEAEEELLASGVLSGVANEREAAVRIVRGQYDSPAGYSRPSKQPARSTRSPSVSSTKGGGSKTRALRESLLGDYSGFRRSLPSMSSRDGSPETSSRASKVSERWRLKAMGLVTMADGTAVPESLARETEFGERGYPGPRPVSYGGISRRSSLAGISRRSSLAGGPRPESRHVLSRSQGSGSGRDPSDAASTNKRKRPSDDDGAAARQGDGGADSPHKRVMSDAEKLISELKTMRQEMEEGATWFRSQNERMQSDIMSRGSTPWEGSI